MKKNKELNDKFKLRRIYLTNLPDNKSRNICNTCNVTYEVGSCNICVVWFVLDLASDCRGSVIPRGRNKVLYFCTVQYRTILTLIYRLGLFIAVFQYSCGMSIYVNNMRIRGLTVGIF